MRLKDLQHERRLVTYENKLGDVYEQYCYIKYVGRRHVILYNYSKYLRMPRDRVLKVCTPTGRVEYEKS